MTYKNDTNLTYKQMGKYIDEHMYDENVDVELIYKYLYLIIYMLSKHYRYFKRNDDYDKFSLFMAGKIYFRLTNKNQFLYDEEGSPKLEKLRSVMRYIKQTIGVYKIQYQKEEFSQNVSKDEYVMDTNYSFDNTVRYYIDKLNFFDFGLTFQNIDVTCKQFLKTIPYKQNSAMWLNIYTSVMMTLLSRLTLKTEHIERIEYLKNKVWCKDFHIAEIYEELDREPPVLYHLPQHMSNYIDVLARQLKHIIAKDLTDIYHTNICTDVMLYNCNYEGVEETYENC